MKPDEPQNDAERGMLLLQLVQTPRNGASGNFDLAGRCIGLLEKGAGTSFADEKGMTALDHALAAKQKPAVKALEAHAQKIETQAEKLAMKSLGDMAVKKPLKIFSRPMRFRGPGTPA